MRLSLQPNQSLVVAMLSVSLQLDGSHCCGPFLTSNIFLSNFILNIRRLGNPGIPPKLYKQSRDNKEYFVLSLSQSLCINNYFLSSVSWSKTLLSPQEPLINELGIL